jgi:cytochrome c2
MATAARASGDAKAGAQVFKRCAICHTDTNGGPNKIGPNLWGVVGRKAGTAPGFNYSAAMKNSGITWTDEKLEAYLMHPQQVVPGDKMPFAGLSSHKQADDVVAYLNTLK